MRKENALTSEIAIWGWDNLMCRLVSFRHQEVDGRILNPEALLLSTGDSIVVISRFAVDKSARRNNKAHLGFVRMLPCASVLSTKLISFQSTDVSTVFTNVQPYNYNGKFTFWKLTGSYHKAYLFDERTNGLTIPDAPNSEPQFRYQVQPGQSLVWKEVLYSCDDEARLIFINHDMRSLDIQDTGRKPDVHKYDGE